MARDIALAELTGGRLHLAHVSTAGAVALLRQAHHRGIPVTAEVCPHHLSITDQWALGNQGIDATGSKYASSLEERASNAARTATASLPARPPGARRAPANRAPATRAASPVRLNRDRPNVAPACRACARATSSAAPRDAPTMSASEEGDRSRRNWWAASSRADADVETSTRNMGVGP